jgi:multiple sugar transport system substrate-binding protein
MNKPQGRVRKWVLSSLALSLLIPLLAACNTNKVDNEDNRRTLRIGTMYGSKQDEYYFRQQFTDMFEFAHSNIDIEVVPAIDYSEMQFEDQSKQQEPINQLEKVKAIMTGTNPVDVMIFDMSMLNQLVNENLLKQMDPLLKEAEIDTTEFVPAVIDGIKEQGNGFLYALTPMFTPSALYYNKKLFNSVGVDFPTDGMSWDDTFNLAKRMTSGTGKESIFGFSFNQWGASENYWDIQNFAAPLQLKMFDPSGELMTVNTPQWENLWTTVTKLYKDHIVPHQDDIQYDQPTDGSGRYNPYQGRLFLNGRVAMAIGDYSLINEITQMNANAEKLKIEPIDWDVVTVPHHVGQEGIGMNVYLNQLSGINATAPNPEDAWEFVKFMNGKEWAKLKSRSTYEMSARMEYVKPRDGMSYNIEAFTKMKPAPLPQSSQQEQELYRQKPNLNMVSEIGSRAYSDIIQDKKSVKEALEFWDTKGNDLLQKIKTKPSGGIDGFYEELNGEQGSIPFEKRALIEASGG